MKKNMEEATKVLEYYEKKCDENKVSFVDKLQS